MKTESVAYYMTAGLKRYLNAIRKDKDSLIYQTAVSQMIKRTVETLTKQPGSRNLAGIRLMTEALMKEQRDNDPQKDYQRVSCRKGCSSCCHVRVEATLDEAKELLQFPLAEDRLEKQAAASDTVESFERLSWEDKACVFLNDGACSVYESRPLACRLYFVAGDPKECDTRVNPAGMVLNYQYNKAECFVTGYYHYNSEMKTIGALPEMLKRAREEQPK